MDTRALLEAAARAYMERERQRVGIPAQEQAAAESETATLMRRLQAQQIMAQMATAPADRELRNQKTRAEIKNLDEPNRPTVPPTETPEARLRRIEDEATARARGTRTGAPPVSSDSGDGSLAANPFLMLDQSTGEYRSAVRVKGGGLKWVDEIEGTPVAPGPTAEMRNTDAQAQAVEPAFELVRKSLDTLKAATEGFGSSVTGMIPGTAAYYAKTRFQDQAKALLGAIVARQSGEGSRLSDEDRKAYSQASTLVNNVILLPGGVEEAEARLQDAETLLKSVIQRRRLGRVPGAKPSGTAGSSGFRIVGVRPKQ